MNGPHIEEWLDRFLLELQRIAVALENIESNTRKPR